MFQDFLSVLRNIFVSAYTYILILAVAGSASFVYGVYLLSGLGFGAIMLGFILLMFMFALCRSINIVP